jgi:hypothetical protein
MQQFELRTAGGDEYPNRLRMLVVGPPGAGKTTLAASFPNPIFATAGGDLTTLSRIGTVPYVNVGSIKDLYYLKLALDRPTEEITELFGRKVETLVIDTVDELQRILLWEHVSNEGRTDTVAGDWGWIAERFHTIFQGLKQLDLHLLVLARTKDVHYSNDRVVIQPALGGAFAESVHKYVDVSAYLEATRDATYESWVRRLDPQDVDVQRDEDQIKITPLSGDNVKRTLHVAPWPHLPWTNDKTASLPEAIDATQADLFLNIWQMMSDVQLPESGIQTVEVPQPEPDVQGEQQSPDDGEEFVCEACTVHFSEKTWSDLSKMKFSKVLCGDCYKKQK